MKKIYHLSLLLIVILITNPLTAQNTANKNILPGSWLGKISTNGIDLRLVFNIKLNDKDSLIATADSPDQGAKDIPGGQVTLNKQKIVIEFPSINGEYTGTVASDSTINGTWAQNGVTLPLNLKKQAASK